MNLDDTAQPPPATNTPRAVSENLATPHFQADDRVYCEDGPVLYSGVIRKACLEHGRWSYLVHYSGWNARFDRWVDEEHLRPETDENRQMFEDQERTKVESEAEERASTEPLRKRKSGRSEHAARKRSGVDKRESYYQEYCELPLTLKTVLLEDWERVTRKGWDSPHGYDVKYSASHPARVVHALPAKVTIRHVLNHFCKTAIKNRQQEPQQQTENEGSTNTGVASAPTTNAEQIQEFCQGLIGLFEQALPTCLLYPQEWRQIDCLRREHPDKPLVDICGCEFLLRLLGRLPILMIPEKRSQTWLGPLLMELIILLQKNRQACFKGQYRHPKREEWLDWEVEMYGGDCEPKPKRQHLEGPYPEVERMDTRSS